MWAAKTIYDVFIKKTDSSDAKMDSMISEMHELSGKVDRMLGRLDSFATKNEAQEIATRAIKFYDELRR